MMRYRTRGVMSLLVVVGICMVMACAPGKPPLVLRNGLVVTATGTDPIPDGIVVVENGLITAVGPGSDVTIPDGANVIDLEGRTIMPGLVDARASDLLSRLKLSEGQIDSVSVEIYLREFLKTGVTTLRATGWTWDAGNTRIKESA